MTLLEILKEFGYEKPSEAQYVYQSDVISLIKSWLKEKARELGDDDASLARDFLKEVLLKEVGEKPFKAYLRCLAPSEACFNCQFIVQCRALNGEQTT